MPTPFWRRQGFPVGKSLMEAELIDTAKVLMSQVDIPLPVDIVVAIEFSADATATVKRVEDVADDDMILDVGPETQASYTA